MERGQNARFFRDLAPVAGHYSAREIAAKQPQDRAKCRLSLHLEGHAADVDVVVVIAHDGVVLVV